jgi:hypothetical protein
VLFRGDDPPDPPRGSLFVELLLVGLVPCVGRLRGLVPLCGGVCVVWFRCVGDSLLWGWVCLCGGSHRGTWVGLVRGASWLVGLGSFGGFGCALAGGTARAILWGVEGVAGTGWYMGYRKGIGGGVDVFSGTGAQVADRSIG